MSSPLDYLTSFCTIHVDVGRRVGKTSYIINNAKSTDLIIVPTRDSKDYIVYKRREKLNVITASSMEFLSKKSFEKWDHKLIYVDEPRICYQYISPINLYYWIFDANVEQTVIMLGE